MKLHQIYTVYLFMTSEFVIMIERVYIEGATHRVASSLRLKYPLLHF